MLTFSQRYFELKEKRGRMRVDQSYFGHISRYAQLKVVHILKLALLLALILIMYHQQMENNKCTSESCALLRVK